MVDYAKLTKIAKTVKQASQLASLIGSGVPAQPGVFFAKVEDCIDAEMNKANVELRKRGIGTIARNHLPNFRGVIFLAIGTEWLCRVELESRMGTNRIIASISGPPNRYVISRKEYVIGRTAQESETEPSPGEEILAGGASPEQIAEDIISGIIVGRLD